MNDQCIHCGIPFQYYKEGFLFLESKADLSEKKVSYVKKGWWKMRYESIAKLTEVIIELNQEIEKYGIQVNGALAESDTVPLLAIPLDRLLVQIQNPETISLIQYGDLISHLQPIVDLQKKGDIFGYESLLRTVQEREISPGRLFSIAAKAGMLSMLDQRAREAAIKAKHQHIRKGLKSFINFLPSTIYNPDFCLRHTFQLVKKYEIDPSDLVFEVVETEKIADMDHLKNVLQTYKREGIGVALDDVGSGFSTIEVLKLLNPDYVKIDRHFVDHCDLDRQKQKFLLEVIHIAKNLGIIVLAEGIERKEELEFCREIGIGLAQGYFIGKPAIRPLNETRGDSFKYL